MPKFLHTADWQIGRLFATFDPEHAPLLAEALIAAVEKLSTGRSMAAYAVDSG